ncbi:MAG: DMT family transporter [Planctomycetota bacterium]|nr:DMT family transporter [Planctomycetota bacterium]
MELPAGERASRPTGGAGPILALALACSGWGLGFTIIKWGQAALGTYLPGVPDAGVTASYSAVRFLAATLVLLPLTWRGMGHFTFAEAAGGGLSGLSFAIGLFLQLWGLHYTSPSTAAFLTSLVVVFTPVAQAVLLRRRPRRQTWAAVAVAAAGMFVLTDPAGGGFGLGELLNFLSSIAFTGQILFLDVYGRRSNPWRFTLAMFAATFAFHLAVLPALPGCGAIPGAVASALAGDGTVQWTMAVTVLYSTLVSFGLMNAFQPMVSPARAAVIYVLEPVFAWVFAVVLGEERPAIRSVLGGSLILVANIIEAAGMPETSSAGAGGPVGAPDHRGMGNCAAPSRSVSDGASANYPPSAE